MKNIWLFGYGSLIWNPDIPYLDWKPATLSGFVRKFWQGSHDHRGTPENPGRVVTLIPCEKGYCDGIAYLVSLSTVKSVFEKLDHREKNGYRKTKVFLNFTDKTNEEAITYIAKSINPAFLGPAPDSSIAKQIAVSSGPSGNNSAYLFKLADALRKHNFIDKHVFELESLVSELK